MMKKSMLTLSVAAGIAAFGTAVSMTTSPAEAACHNPRTSGWRTDTFCSDIRLKRDIVQVGRLQNGLGLYSYRYHGKPAAYVGVMAHEVRAVAPHAVVRGKDGYDRVNYRKLGLSFMTLADWNDQYRL
jgi:hypothetical protein